MSDAFELRKLFQHATEIVANPDRWPGLQNSAREVLDSFPGDLRESFAVLPRLNVESFDNDRGQFLGNLNNAVTVLEHDRMVMDIVWWDEFLGRVMTGHGGACREWTDTDDMNLTLFMQRQVGLKRIGRDTVGMAVQLVAHRHVTHCLRDWLNSLRWDNTARIGKFFSDYCSTEPSAYALSVGKNFFLSMVARVIQPGCKMDTMIVLEGEQGARKSSMLRIIGGDYYAEQHESVTTKDFYQVLQGKWLIEISEMDAFTRPEVDKIKAVISCANDRYRETYARRSIDHPRQCVFAGTTNRDNWNRDETGARRFWPIPISGIINLDGISAHRDQLFAEAVASYKAGDHWWEMPEEETRYEQESRFCADPWLEPIRDFVEMKRQILTNEILTVCFKLDISRIDAGHAMRVGKCLRHLGWKSGNVRVGKKVRKVWTKDDDE